MFEFLQDLCAAYRQKGLRGNEKHIKLHIACVAEAVAFIHDRRVTHRDIKPPNLLLDAPGNCKLADFGAAKIGSAQTRTCVGTP